MLRWVRVLPVVRLHHGIAASFSANQGFLSASMLEPTASKVRFVYSKSRSAEKRHKKKNPKGENENGRLAVTRRGIWEKSEAQEAEEAQLAAKFSVDELRPEGGMLEKIVAEHQAQGTVFVIPGPTSPNRDDVVAPFARLVQIGVRPEFVLDACAKKPLLFRLLVTRGGESLQIIETIVGVGGLTYEDALRVLAEFGDELHQCGAKGVGQRLEAIVASGATSSRELAAAIRRCPPVLFARPPEEMRSVAEAIGGFFTRRQVAKVVTRCPQILLKSVDEIEAKYDYVFYEMAIEGEELSECGERWVESLSLEQIQTRHMFLVLTGKYTMPDPKRPQFRMENPRLSRILDTPDENFATQVAGVSVEEWTVFQALREKQLLDDQKAHGLSGVLAEAQLTREGGVGDSAVAGGSGSGGPTSPPAIVDATTTPTTTASTTTAGAAATAATGDERMMTINEHLSSLPMPWLEGNFRSPITQQELEMLNLGIGGGLEPRPQAIEASAASNNNKTPPPTPNGRCLPQQSCGENVSSPESTISTSGSSSSCSPTTATPQENTAAAIGGHDQHRSEGRHVDASEVELALGVGGAPNGSAISNNHDNSGVDRSILELMKTEPVDDGVYMLGRAGGHHRHCLMQPMPLHLSFGRCSDGAVTTSECPPAPTRRTRSVNDGMLKCRFCPKKFINDRLLHTHMGDCRMVRSHECIECGRRFKARGGLQQHMRIHSHEKPYNCRFCTKRFTQKSHLDQHERIHTGTKPFTCQFCGRAFRQRSQQLGHEATHGNQSSSRESRDGASSSTAGRNTTQSSPGAGGVNPTVKRGRPSNSGVNNNISNTNNNNNNNNNHAANHIGLDLDAATTAAAAVMMQQQHMGSMNDLLGHLENSREMMEGLSPASVAAHMNMNPTISSLLALSSQQHHQQQQQQQQQQQGSPLIQQAHHQQHMQQHHDMQQHLLQHQQLQLHQQHMQVHHQQLSDFPTNMQMQHAVGLINGLHG